MLESWESRWILGPEWINLSGFRCKKYVLYQCLEGLRFLGPFVSGFWKVYLRCFNELSKDVSSFSRTTEIGSRKYGKRTQEVARRSYAQRKYRHRQGVDTSLINYGAPISGTVLRMYGKNDEKLDVSTSIPFLLCKCNHLRVLGVPSFKG